MSLNVQEGWDRFHGMGRRTPPTETELARYAADWGFESPTDEELIAWRAAAETWIDALDPLTEFEESVPKDRGWRRPIDAEDPNAAYLARTEIRSAADGPLAGVAVAIKDNIAVAGVPMTCGSRALADYRPTADAAVVRRILDAGGTIAGKTTMSEFALGGDEDSMRFRRPCHPTDPDRYPGGSSSGSAVAVAEGSADTALGSDTAASIRCPAAFCGIVGIKPTHGLVPTHGFVGFAPSLDVVGTLSRDIRRGALLLETIAGEGGGGGRPGRGVGAYSRAAERGRSDVPETVSIGVPERARADDAVADAFETALDDLEAAGVTVERITIPGYGRALPAWLAVAATEFRSYLAAYGDDPVSGAVATAVEERTHECGPSLREFLVCAEHLRRAGAERLREGAQRARTRATDGIRRALNAVDVLATPTMPTVAPRWVDRNTGGEGEFLGSVANTAPFSVSGHPAVSIPCGRADGFPVGLQLVGRQFGEARLLRIAAAFEAVVDPSGG